MLDFLPTLFAGITYTSLIAGFVFAVRWGLIALVTLVGVFNDGPKGRNARAVLKLLLGPKRDAGNQSDA